MTKYFVKKLALKDLQGVLKYIDVLKIQWHVTGGSYWSKSSRRVKFFEVSNFFATLSFFSLVSSIDDAALS